MNPAEYRYTLDRALFFQIGRALQRGIGKKMLGEISLSVRDGRLEIDSEWGGGQIPCRGAGEISANMNAKAFCTLITTRFREKSPSGEMLIIFNPGTKEISIDKGGARGKDFIHG